MSLYGVQKPVENGEGCGAHMVVEVAELGGGEFLAGVYRVVGVGVGVD